LSVAVVRPGGMGDAVLTIPLLQALKESVLVSAVTLVADPGNCQLLGTGGISALPYDFKTTHVFNSGWRASLAKAMAVSAIAQHTVQQAGSCHRGEFDLVILPRWDTDTGFNARSWAAGTGSYIVGHDCQASTKAPCSERRENALLDLRVSEDSTIFHEMRHLESLMLALGLPHEVTQSGYASEYFGLNRSIKPKKNLEVVIHPAAASPARQWPAQFWVDFIQLVHNAVPSCRFALVGAGSDSAIHRAIIESTGCRVESFIGKVTLTDLPARLAEASIFVGSDSGPAHLASGVGLQTVVISPHPVDGFPQHENSPFRFFPWNSDSVVFQPDHSRVPCDRACSAAQPHCILDVKPPDVAEFVIQQITVL
jgi:heptosyltransferase-2